MKLVKSLSAIAALGCAIPSTYALSVKDDQLSVNLKVQVQERAYLLNDAQDASGNDYDPLRNSEGKAEFARFDLRRARFGISAKYNDDWRGNFLIRAENNDRTGANTGGRALQLYYANAARVFKQGDDIEHDLHGGLDKPFNSESSISSTTYIMPQDRPTLSLIEFRGVGVGYGFRSPMFNFGVDVQDNSTAVKDAQASSNAGESQTNGYFYSGRIEFMPGKDWNPGKRQESYAGKEGTHLVVGFDVQADRGSLTDDAAAATFTKADTTIFGPDVLFHWNFLTILAEYRWRTVKSDVVTDATGASVSTDAKGKVYNIGAGWAFPVGKYFIEPAVRYGRRDTNKDVASTAPYASTATGAQNIGNDMGTDGKTYEVGVNWYISGHNNKLQLSYQKWKAESGDADANIIRLQHQWAF